jgi:serine protease Do
MWFENEKDTGVKRLQTGFVRGFSIGIGMVLLLLGGALAFHSSRVTHAAAAPAAEAAPATAAALSKGFEAVAKQVEPAVVNINTEQIIHNAASRLHDPFRDFFGDDSPFGGFLRDMPRDLKQKSLGSGFVVEANGYILTNNHVIENANKIKVKLADGRILDAKVVGADPQTDLAVLKVAASGLPVLKIADSDQTEVGEWVLAFGSPFGLTQTMTAGIISAKGRVIGAGPYDNFLQTDAAINPGNSGGPLVDLEGRVVGINTMIASESGGFQGVGFAIPSAMASSIYGQIVKNGKVSRGWLGVQIQSLTPELARSFNLTPDKGVLIAQVEPDSPAGRSGLQSGDVIVKYNGKEVHNAQDLSLAVAETPAGFSAKMDVLRNGKPMTLEVKVGQRAEKVAESSGSPEEAEHGKLGISVERITPEIERAMNLPSGRGALVSDVKQGSPADDAGVQAGDVIREINHVQVNTVGDLMGVVRSLKGGSTVLLKVQRQDQAMFLAFDLS